jgi:rfaE bifunctional protein nucleotidyltransferase chain/domain
MVKVWTNGCFDVLHRGHLEMLRYAKSLGDILVVGVDSDSKVRNAKGPSRPFNTLENRIALLRELRCVDEVVSFDSAEELEQRVKEYKPEYLVVGSDWQGKKVVGEEYAQKVRFFDRVGTFSTTQILEYLK